MPSPVVGSLRTGPVRLPDTVGLVRGAGIDPSAERVVREVLDDAGVRRVVVIGADPVDPDPAVTVWLQTVGSINGRRGGGGSGSGSPPAEAYRLVVGHDRSGRGHVVLDGTDPAGTFYAAGQFGRRMSGRTVGSEPRDAARRWVAPAMRFRGVVEGFYGTPWTHAERLRLIDFLGAHRMNTYHYAPKSDPYHRQRWRDPYPDEQMVAFTELVEHAGRNHVDIRFGISPGASICYSSTMDVEALLAKYETMYRIGVRGFTILLDEIDYERWNCAGDRIAYGAGGAAAGRAHADLLNRLQEWVTSKGDVTAMHAVPSECHDIAPTAYKRMLADQLDPAVVLLWVGTVTSEDRTSLDQLAALREVYRHRICLWANYPVNDHVPGRLLLAPYSVVERGVSAEAVGVLSNPMNQSAVSRLALHAFGELGWDDREFDVEAVRGRALSELASGDQPTIGALRRFADLHWYDASAHSGSAPRLSADIARFWEGWRSGREEAAAADLRAVLRELSAAPERIAAGVTDPAFVEQSRPWLDGTALWADALEAAVDCAAAVVVAGDGERAWRQRRQAFASVERAMAIRDTRSPHDTSPPLIADGVADVLLADLARIHAEAVGAVAPRVIVDAPRRVGPQVTVDLERLHSIGEIVFRVDPGDGTDDFRRLGVLEYSADGRTWSELTPGGPPVVAMTAPSGARARYVRFRAIDEEHVEWLQVREATVQTLQTSRLTVGGGPPATRRSALARAVDGDLESAYIASRLPVDGDALIVRWPEPRPLAGAVVLQTGRVDARVDARSAQDDSWRPIGALTGEYTELTVDDAAEVAALRLAWIPGSEIPQIAAIVPRFAD